MAASLSTHPDLVGVEFDSDDDEQASRLFGLEAAPKSRPFQNAGEAMLNRMIDNQLIDRVESKRAFKNLDFTDGSSAHVQYRHAFIKNMVLGYFELVNHDPAFCPSGSIIFRCISTLVKRVKSGAISKPKPSITTIKSMWYLTICFLRFTYPNLKDNYTSHDQIRITRYLAEEVKQGNLIKGTWEEKVWLGFHVTTRMMNYFIRSAVQGGCISWDMVILRCLGVSLTVACACRNSDLARSGAYYDRTQVLHWEDIELTVSDASKGVQQLQAKLTIRYEKSRKDDPSDNRIVFFSALERAEDSCMCPIKLLMVHALRHGLCYGTTVPEVLKDAMGTRNKLVRWRYPKYPVLCARKKNPHLLDLTAPAPATQITESIRSMGIVSGIIGHLKARDLRRGSARDTTHLAKTLRGSANVSTGLVLGHTRKTVANDISQRYSGPLQEDILSLRANSDFKDRLAPALSEPLDDEILPTVRRKVTPKWQIDERLRQDGIDPVNSTPHQRKRASEFIRKELSLSTPLEKRPMPPPSPVAHKKAKISPRALPETASKRQPLTELSSNSNVVASLAAAPIDPSVIDPALLSWSGLDAPLADIGYAELEGEDEFSLEERHANANPEHCRVLDDLVQCRQCQSQEAVDTDAVDLDNPALSKDPFEEALFMQVVADEFAQSNNDPQDGSDPDEHRSSTSTHDQPWLLTGDEWVAYFSAINVCIGNSLHGMSPDEAAKVFPTGNTRNPPTVFLYYCGKGCGYSSHRAGKRREHQVRCSGLKEAKPRLFQCEVEGCAKAYSTERDLKRHHQKVHDYKPRKCLRCPPEESPLFTTEAAYHLHETLVHDALEEPTTCPLSETCHSETKFSTRHALKSHLKLIHELALDQVDEYVPRKPGGASRSAVEMPEPRHCPIDDCPEKEEFHTAHRLKIHLQQKHKFEADDATTRAELLMGPLTTSKAPRSSVSTVCPMQSDCKSTRSFSSRTAGKLRDHLIAKHNMDYEPARRLVESTLKITMNTPMKRDESNNTSTCPLPSGCRTKQVFSSRDSNRLLDHLRTTHKMSYEDAKALTTTTLKMTVKLPEKNAPIKMTRCSLHNVCRSTTLFASNNASQLREHLIYTHKMTKVEAIKQADVTFEEATGNAEQELTIQSGPCPLLETCKSTASFASNKAYVLRAHLREWHKLQDAEAIRLTNETLGSKIQEPKRKTVS